MPTRLWLKLLMLAGFLATAVPADAWSEAPNTGWSVYARDGNIFLKVEDRAVQLTKTGMDHEPVLSPDGKRVAFSRKIEGKTGECAERKEWVCATEQLWLLDLATQTERMIVEPAENISDLARLIVEFRNKAFSPDGKTLYFETSSPSPWGGAIHAVDANGRNERFVTYGGGLKVIKRTNRETWAGHLIVGKNKFFLGGGSYSWYWLVSPEGRELEPLGEDTKSFAREYAVEYMEKGSPDPSD